MVRVAPDLTELGWESVRRAEAGGFLSLAWKPWLGSDPAASQKAFQALERCVAYLRLAIETDSSDHDSPLGDVLWGEALRALSEAGFASTSAPGEAFALLNAHESTRSLVQREAVEIVAAFHACGERGLVRLRGVLNGELGRQVERFAHFPEKMPPHRAAGLLATAASQACLVELTRRAGLGGNLQPIRPLLDAARRSMPILIGAAFTQVLVPAIEAVAPSASQQPRDVPSAGPPRVGRSSFSDQ